MNPLLLGGLFDVAKSLIDRFFPDPEKKAEAQLKLLDMQQKGELAELASSTTLAQAQIAVNQEEAKSPSLFVSGWRPAAGWACVGGLVYQVVFRPIFGWVMFNLFAWNDPPSLEMDTLMTILFGMLGLGAYRTYEKKTDSEGNR